jgi:hypothetical protein
MKHMKKDIFFKIETIILNKIDMLQNIEEADK